MRRGPLYMALAALVFTIMVVALKTARESLSAIDVTAWRSIVAIPLMALIGFKQLGTVRRKGLLALRCVLGFTAVIAFVTAAKHLSVANLSLIHKLQPVWIALLAPAFLGMSERPERRVWLALVFGLAGAALIVQPGLDGDAATLRAGMWAMGGAFFSALAHVSLRALGHTEDPRAVVFWFQSSLLPLSLLAMLLQPHQPGSGSAVDVWPALLVIGATAVCGQLLMTHAYKLDKAAPTAAASYSGPLWAYALDYLLFDVTPTPIGLLGGALVLCAGAIVVFGGGKLDVRSTETVPMEPGPVSSSPTGSGPTNP